MSALTGSDWDVDGGGRVAEMTRRAEVGQLSWREKYLAIRDTLIVFAMQIVFRATMFLRHMNY